MSNVQFSNIGQAIKELDLFELEKRVGAALPADYRHFLLLHNGGQPEPSDFLVPGWRFMASLVNEFDGIKVLENQDVEDDNSVDLLWNIEVFEDRLPKNFLFIGRDPGGNGILLSLHPDTYGKIYFWDHENEPEEGLEDLADYPNIYFLANSFTEFLDSLKTEEEINALIEAKTS